jgi:Ca2+/H+ antiporter, TMEM165/GDT1 family
VEAILPVFIAILLAETGGRAQARGHDLQLQFNAPGAILGALSLTTLASLLVAGIGGALIARAISFDARSLLAGLALLFAGAPMVLRARPAREVNAKSAFGAGLKGFAPLQFGDASQFIVFAMAARTGQIAFAVGAGAAATMIAVAVPVIMGRDWPGDFPLGISRRIAALLLVSAGCWMIITALRLI